MKTRVVVCALSVLALVVLLGAAPVRAEEPAASPQPAVSAQLPASLTAPAEGEECLNLVDPLSGATTNLCGEGCSFEVPSYCNDACCGGGWGACIDTWDGGYCVC